MSKYLISTNEVYRVDTEQEAKKLIEEAKADHKFQLSKYVSEYKEVKQKKEVIDTYYKVTLNKVFNDIKEPVDDVEIKYEKDIGGAFSTREETEKIEEGETAVW